MHIALCRDVTGVPGHWLLHTSDQFCESLQISYNSLCHSWYTEELQNRFSFSFVNPFSRLPPCPCRFGQARWDRRYSINSRTRCATLRFGFSTTTQVVFTARAYARAVLGVVILSVRPSVCLSVCLSHACIVTKLNDALHIFLYHTKGQSLCYSDTKSGWWATPHSL